MTTYRSKDGEHWKRVWFPNRRFKKFLWFKKPHFWQLRKKKYYKELLKTIGG